MATTYALTNVVVTPLLRDPEEGQLIQINFSVTRNGSIIGSVDQRYLATLSNADIRADLVEKVRAIAGEDYDALQWANLVARCQAIAANLADVTKVFP